MKLKGLFPVVFFAACVGGAAYVALHYTLRGNLGPSCDLKEQFASAGRPAYSHHCVCWGLKYNEIPPPGPGADATRCFGVVRKRWTDKDEVAIHELSQHERVAKNEQFFARLSPEIQTRVKLAYKRLQEGAYRNDYPYMIEQAQVILREVEDYGETKGLDALARKALGRANGGTVPAAAPSAAAPPGSAP